MNGALIIGLESRVSQIEDKLEDLDARTSEEADNALNEREMDRFIMSGDMSDLYLGLLNFVLIVLLYSIYLLIFYQVSPNRSLLISRFLWTRLVDLFDSSFQLLRMMT